MPRVTDQAAKFKSPKLIKRSFGLDNILRTKNLMDGFQIGVTSSVVFTEKRVAIETSSEIAGLSELKFSDQHETKGYLSDLLTGNTSCSKFSYPVL
jgi:hypothetical protein